MNAKKEFDEKWIVLFYERVTDQFSLSRQSLHNTHQWMITLVFGLITAVFAVFQTRDEFPYEYGLIAILITFPLFLRFFIRSCLEYSIQRKWQEIRNLLDEYFLDVNEYTEIKLRKAINLYYFDWKSPITIWKIIWANFQLAYLWPFIVYFGLLGWLASNTYLSPIVLIVTVFVSIFVFFEIVCFFRYSGFHHEKIAVNKS